LFLLVVGVELVEIRLAAAVLVVLFIKRGYLPPWG
jgi:hypothetical protein